tara:strand:- start:191 stop:718 length:528 start_codon:yes stop_codon:yes gene_type:complete
MSKAADLAKFIGGGFSGKVLQLVSTNKTDKTNSADFDASFENVTGLTVNITPSSTSSKIYVIATLQVSVHAYHLTFRIARGGSTIVEPSAAGNRMLGMAHIYGHSSYNDHYNIESKVMQVLDSPSSTSEITYSVQGRNAYNPNTTGLVVNSTNNDGDASYNSRVISTITAMEIAG